MPVARAIHSIKSCHRGTVSETAFTGIEGPVLGRNCDPQVGVSGQPSEMPAPWCGSKIAESLMIRGLLRCCTSAGAMGAHRLTQASAR